MEKFLVVFRGATVGEAEGPRHDPLRWDSWFEGLGQALLDRGALSHGSVEVPTRLVGAKLSSSPLSGYCVIAASDFNDAVRLAQASPIFDEKGSVEIAHLR
ncbi:hypothetical protein G4G28_18205 [Massilia sp. Dwa41.01b]|uniref:hypothetical protein n=1 Tax=Massilia sp. Dwa41.01b TaxID=2709302 RepID=UPI0016037E6B|nr:hypothetical protein [Massilia sp. Dwa41.01b]QNA89945.1 hypothetical protein G4G28_18205 [Massilia sp. Dwa41.01b]